MTDTPPRHDLLIGAPVHDRAWILPKWYEHVVESCEYANVEDYAFLFVGDNRDNSYEAIKGFPGDQKVYFVQEDEPDPAWKYFRSWNKQRYERMALLRNRLLDAAISIEPQQFLSLDTDILIAQTGISSLRYALETQDFVAVGGRAYMTPHGTWAPSYAYLTPGEEKLSRTMDYMTVVPVDVIMAIKLMSPVALHEGRYGVHEQGEDIFWSKSLTSKGYKLGYDGLVANKHVMSEPALTIVDPRCGY